jgi:hypothetical protein
VKETCHVVITISNCCCCFDKDYIKALITPFSKTNSLLWLIAQPSYMIAKLLIRNCETMLICFSDFRAISRFYD